MHSKIKLGVGVTVVLASVITGGAMIGSASHQMPAIASNDRIVPTGQRPITVHRLLVVGASYTAALGASSLDHGYAEQLGRELGWPTVVAGSPGTGFVNEGPHRAGTFAQRLSRVPGQPFGVVLVQCGRNDVGYPEHQQLEAITHTVTLIRQRFAGSQVVFLGPIPGGLPVGRGVGAQSELLARAAVQLQVPYIDPVVGGWITPQNIHGYTGQVPNHPDDAGYGYIAHRSAAALRQLFPNSFTDRVKPTPHVNPTPTPAPRAG